MTAKLLAKALPYPNIYSYLASHKNISDAIARKIIARSYAETLLTEVKAKAILIKRDRYGDYKKYYKNGSSLKELKARHRRIKENLVRNYNLSLEVLSELIPTQEVLDSKQPGTPELLRYLLRALPPGAEREMVADRLLVFDKKKPHHLNKKLIAKTTNDPKLLEKLAYDSNVDIRNTAAHNPAASEEDKTVVALFNNGVKKPNRLKTRF